jgi:hypothetical protein
VIVVRHLDTNGLDVLVRKLYSPQMGSYRKTVRYVTNPFFGQDARLSPIPATSRRPDPPA